MTEHKPSDISFAITDTVRHHYRQLHRIPEVSCQEEKTAAYLEQALTAAGYAPRRVGKTGLFADLVTDPALPWLLLRADMDALPIQEQSGLSYASEHPGVMHACGHDAHCAMLLTAAQALQGKKLPQNIRFLFQPAEENTLGAVELIQWGAIPKNTLACFAIHVWPGVPEGRIYTKTGAMMASSDVFWFDITGNSAHCAQRHKGNDALQTALAIANALPDIQAQAQEEAIVFCGSLHSGSSHNIVPGEASLRGTIRTYSPADRQRLRTLLIEAAEAATAQYGTSLQLQWIGGCPAVTNDAETVQTLAGILPGLLTGKDRTMAGEDFALYQELLPGAMLWLGTGDTPPLHNEAFFVPEQILPAGVSTWCAIAAHCWRSH